MSVLASLPRFHGPEGRLEDLSARQRWGILAICCMSLLIVGLDTTIVNVALPDSEDQFHSSLSGLQWVVDAYTLVLASLLMLSGATADRIGRRRMFRIGLLIFTLGSALCSLAPDLPLLVVFRMLQAVGGSMLNPVAMSIITNTFTDRRERAQAIGIWGVAIGVSMALGPIVGGVLTTSVGWQAVFWINIPVGLAAIALTTRFIPESRAPRPRRPDPAAQLLVVVGLAALTFAIIEAPRWGWGSPWIVACFVLAVLGFAGLIRYEHHRREPLIDTRFFRSAPFSGATAIAISGFACLGGFLLINTLYLQDGRHLSALHAGLDTLPMAVVWLVCAPIAGRVVGRTGGRVPLLIAGVTIIVGALMLTRIQTDTSTAWLFAAYAIFGVGMGFVNPPISVTAVSGMPASQAGVAAAIASTSRQVGSTLGVAIFGALTTLAQSGPVHRSLAAATHDAWWVMVGCGAAVLILGLVTTGRWAANTAARTAALVAD